MNKLFIAVWRRVQLKSASLDKLTTLNEAQNNLLLRAYLNLSEA